MTKKRVHGWLAFVLSAFPLAAFPLVALSHDGHGNTPIHALIHMLESNGIWIGLIFLVAVVSLVHLAQRVRSNRSTQVRKQVHKHGGSHDPR